MSVIQACIHDYITLVVISLSVVKWLLREEFLQQDVILRNESTLQSTQFANCSSNEINTYRVALKETTKRNKEKGTKNDS